ncbi:MAG: hypothetical protein WAS36_01410 [Candidatus Saccharimonadales bacterium]
MSYASPETFPRVLLQHETIDSTVAIVGLIHVVPQSRVGMYHEVAKYAQTRLTLPHSTVHYEMAELPDVAEEQEFAQRNPAAYHSAIVNDDLMGKVITLLCLVEQESALYNPHISSDWANHDATAIEIVEQESTQDVIEENSELEVFYKQLLQATPEARIKKGEEIFRELFEGGVSVVEMSEHGSEREDIAVNAVLRELLLGTRHFTLLWGMDHLLNLQHAFELQGYKTVKG